MRIIERIVEKYRDSGLSGLISDGSSYLKTNVVMGGLSSRPRIQYVSGLFRPIFNYRFQRQYGEGINMLEEDWDTLILLDACRYDDFARQHSFDGTLEHRISRGADSREFIKKNFIGAEAHDTVYVTANPHVHLLNENDFHAIVDEPISRWDPETRCVRPSDVTAVARRIHEEYDDKRIIVHYMQPHDPPLGPTATELRQHMSLEGPSSDGDTDGVRLLAAVAAGELSKEKARKAYRETLNVALDSVEDLTADIEGKIVITADHGELFGERPLPLLGDLYEHYRHPRTQALCKVPWLVLQQGPRRQVRKEPPTGYADDAVNVADQLEALGYR